MGSADVSLATLAVSQPAADFVQLATPEAWLEAAVADLPTLLTDHANCERKAAATALALIARYPARRELLLSLSKLAREEMRHFEQVLAVMANSAMTFGPLSASRYASSLMAEVVRDGDARLIDTLVVGAVVEARSCERFAALVPVLPATLSSFYRKLLASEARHFEMYLEHSRRVCESSMSAGQSAVYLSARVAHFIALDNELISTPDRELRFHSGPPG